MSRTIVFDSEGNDITCIKEFSALKYPCQECKNTDCEEREDYYMSQYERKLVKMEDIKIPECFVNTNTSREKIDACKNYYTECGKQLKHVQLSKDYTLTDGYAMYLAAKELGWDVISAKIKRNKVISKKSLPYRNVPTTYVYGVHQNSVNDKEYMWRLPVDWNGAEISVDDLIICKTKFGNVPVVVTGVETLNECPVKRSVKRVVRKVNKSE